MTALLDGETGPEMILVVVIVEEVKQHHLCKAAAMDA